MTDQSAAPSRAATVTVTDSAVKRIAHLIQQEGMPGAKLRVSVSGGGCSGFQYGFAFETQHNEDDVAIERDGVTVLIDEVSLQFLAGAEIDYVEDLIGSAFNIRNPNASSSCGCGTSFSI